jgi:hypothetical protein
MTSPATVTSSGVISLRLPSQVESANNRITAAVGGRKRVVAPESCDCGFKAGSVHSVRGPVFWNRSNQNSEVRVAGGSVWAIDVGRGRLVEKGVEPAAEPVSMGALEGSASRLLPVVWRSLQIGVLFALLQLR